MADPIYALDRLAQTLGTRGGLTQSRIQGVNALTNLKLAESGLKRSEAAENRSAEEFSLRKPVLEQQANEAKYLNEVIPIYARDIYPQNKIGLTATFTPDKYGNSTYDISNKMIDGSKWDPKTGQRLNEDNTPVMIPRWKWEKRIRPALMMTYISRNDPSKFLSDKYHDLQSGLESSKEDPQIYNRNLAQLEEIKSTLKDKSKMALLYGRQISAIHDAMAWGYSTGANPDFMNMLETEQKRASGRFDQYVGTEKGNLELDKLKQEIETSKAQADKFRAEAQYTRTGKGGMTGYQTGRLMSDIWKQWSDELANPMSPYHRLQTKEEKDAYQQQFIVERQSAIMPGANNEMGLGGPTQQTGQPGQAGKPQIGEIRLAPEGTEGAGKYWQYGQDGQWKEVAPPAKEQRKDPNKDVTKGLTKPEQQKLNDIKSGYSEQNVTEMGETKGGLKYGKQQGGGMMINFGGKWRTPSKLEFDDIIEAERVRGTKKTKGNQNDNKIKDLNLPKSSINTLVKMYGKDVLERDASEIAKLLEGK